MGRAGQGTSREAATNRMLPPEILLDIFSFLSTGSARATLCQAAFVCCRWRVAQTVLFETLELDQSNMLRWLHTESRTRFTIRNLKLEARSDLLFSQVSEASTAVDVLEVNVIDRSIPLPLLKVPTLSQVKTLTLYGLGGWILQTTSSPSPFELRHFTLHLFLAPRSREIAQLLIHASRSTLISLSLIDNS